MAFLENDFKYQNAHDNEFGGAISVNYGGFFTISCLPFDIFLYTRGQGARWCHRVIPKQSAHSGTLMFGAVDEHTEVPHFLLFLFLGFPTL